jgi:hypothetical protein
MEKFINRKYSPYFFVEESDGMGSFPSLGVYCNFVIGYKISFITMLYN